MEGVTRVQGTVTVRSQHEVRNATKHLSCAGSGARNQCKFVVARRINIMGNSDKPQPCEFTVPIQHEGELRETSSTKERARERDSEMESSEANKNGMCCLQEPAHFNDRSSGMVKPPSSRDVKNYVLSRWSGWWLHMSACSSHLPCKGQQGCTTLERLPLFTPALAGRSVEFEFKPECQNLHELQVQALCCGSCSRLDTGTSDLRS